MRPVIIWYLRRFRVNERDDPEQMARYRRTLKAAHPHRLKLSARAVLGYTVWPGIERIAAPVAIAYAANDTLHGPDEVRRLASALPRGEAVECPTNTYMHTEAVADDLERFISRLND